MRSLRLREQMLLWGLGFFAVVAAFYFFVYSPTTNEAASLAKRLGGQRAEVARLEKEAPREKELDSEIADLQNAIRVLEANLPSGHEISQLLLQLDELAGQTGVTLTSLKPGVLEAATAAPAAPAGPPRTGRRAASPAPATLAGRLSKASQPETANYQKFTIDLETKGSFPAILEFAHGLEFSPHFLAISDMRVTLAPARRGDDPADPALSLGVTATVYVRPESGDTP